MFFIINLLSARYRAIKCFVLKEGDDFRKREKLLFTGKEVFPFPRTPFPFQEKRGIAAPVCRSELFVEDGRLLCYLGDGTKIICRRRLQPPKSKKINAVELGNRARITELIAPSGGFCLPKS